MDSGLKHAGGVVHGRTVHGTNGCNDRLTLEFEYSLILLQSHLKEYSPRSTNTFEERQYLKKNRIM